MVSFFPRIFKTTVSICVILHPHTARSLLWLLRLRAASFWCLVRMINFAPGVLVSLLVKKETTVFSSATSYRLMIIQSIYSSILGKSVCFVILCSMEVLNFKKKSIINFNKDLIL